jgi:hypothetical protein
MADELLSFRIIVVAPSPSDRAMFRNAAATARVPIELVENDSETAGARSIAAGADLAFFDTALGREAVMRMASAARATARPPFTIALCAPDDSGLFPTDGQASRPVDEDDARRLIAGSIRLRLPARVLLVDDSPTMRGIVRKVLAATRFPLEVTEAGEGGEALALACAAEFDLVFFDYNLPGLSGLEAIAELRRGDDLGGRRGLGRKGACPGHRLSEKAVLPGGSGKGPKRLLRFARAQSRALVKRYWRDNSTENSPL